MPNRRTEDDVDGDPALADARETGGVPDEDALENQSTTSPTDTPDYVGRIAGDEAPNVGMDGAEARALADDDSETDD